MHKTMELDGKTYKRIGDHWYDAETFIRPPQIVVQRLEARTPTPKTEKKSSSSSRSRTKKPSKRWGREFDGLEETDFKDGITGTSWRRRGSLGGLLAKELTNTTPCNFISYAVPRRPQIYVANPDCLDRSNKYPAAKFHIQLDEEKAWYGFYVEKNDGPMDRSWDWKRCLESLARDEDLQTQLETAMAENDLHWEVELLHDDNLVDDPIQVTLGDPLAWQANGETEPISWEEFVEKLKELPQSYWCNLYLGKHMDKAQALAAGTNLADSVIAAYEAIYPLYDASTHADN